MGIMPIMPPLSRIVYVNCERTAPGLLEEPFNAVSSLLFFVIAYILFKQYKKLPTQPGPVLFLIIMTALVGAGSLTFHTTARMWGALLDALPIAIFAISYLYLFGRHILRLSVTGSVLLMVAFAVINIVYKAHVIHSIDGYISLIPGLFCLLLISLHMLITKHQGRINFSLATILACIATAFRVLDFQICKDFPPGTHFVWHILMALFFYFNMRELIKDYRSDIKNDGKALGIIWLVIIALALTARFMLR